jgi:hypothetical protein
MAGSELAKYGKWVVYAVVLVCLLVITWHVVKISDSLGNEKFADLAKFAQSYTSGATQRFQQENSDPGLGGQFGPYNMDIKADEMVYGSENLTSAMEPPVIYNEPGLHNMHDSAEARAPGRSGNNVEDLISELYN